jgi:lysophospholipase L1-like esterase
METFANQSRLSNTLNSYHNQNTMKITHRLSIGLLSAFVLAAANPPAHAQNSYKFVFGGTAESGWTQITPANLYSTNTGYGFEPGTLPVAVGSDALGAEKPFYFSVAEPEGNYKVTVTFGSAAAASDNTVKAELRRLMLEKIHTDPGQSVTRSFIVNVRIPQYPGGQVRLKAPRETTQEARAWDDKLTLEFNRDDAQSAVSKVEIEKVDVPTIYILGDSTVCDQSGETFNSWGQMLTRWFDTDVAIANHAESGETLASSIGERRFAKVYSLLKPGDYVFMQFAHNDMKSTAPNALDTYKANYVKVIGEIRAKGAIPVVVASMERSSGVFTDTLKGYPAAALATAAAQNVASIDLHSMSQKFYQALGPDVKKAFNDGVTHHNNYGSYEMAKMIVMGIKADKLDIAKYIVPDFKDFDPSHPDSMATFKMALSAGRNAPRPLGDESTFGAGATNAAPAAPTAPPAQ